MRPTLAAVELQRTITQYLSTTFALADAETRDTLADFLNDPEHGIFRGPYLRVRPPFRTETGDWRRHLQWAPPKFNAFTHQAAAFARLSTLQSPAEPTLITTGTGSGKTESFLLPVLDHCRRARNAGRNGVKAVLLYPMNALATDQAKRIGGYLTKYPALGQVTAGLYIGGTPSEGLPGVLTRREDMRSSPPDILITNYKMLDLLLQRALDRPLWHGADLTYVVVDEFHTYDGAQGTDVAMLLRRLAAAVGRPEPGRPLGRICPVATSATLGAGETSGDTDGLLDIARTVFGMSFSPEAVITEDRLRAEEFLDPLNYDLPDPHPDELAALPDPTRGPEAFQRVVRAVTGQEDLSPAELGALLKRHILTSAVLEALSGEVADLTEMIRRLPRTGGGAEWGRLLSRAPKRAAEALSRFIALLSAARDPEDPSRPFVMVESHVWVRAVSRLLRTVHTRPSFAWHSDQAETADENAAPAARLPSVYCRHCGRSGWAALSTEASTTDLVTEPLRIYRAGVSGHKARRRAFIAATAAEATAAGRSGNPVLVLSRDGGHVRPLAPVEDTGEDGPSDGVAVLALLDDDRAGEHDTCPACGLEQGIRFLGSGLAALASVAVTQLMTSGELSDRGAPKTLLFNESVQDAAHRAGFVADRAYAFSLRALITGTLAGHPERTMVPLNEIIAEVVEAAGDAGIRAAVVPPDLHDNKGVAELLAGKVGGRKHAWTLVGERLAFAAIMEFGLRSRMGRTLELTRTVAAEVVLDGPDTIAALARDAQVRYVEPLPEEHQDTGKGERAAHDQSENWTEKSRKDLSRYRLFVRGLLERIRLRGGVKHQWLNPYLDTAGRRHWLIWGGRPVGMPAFPRGRSSPRFVLDSAKGQTDFDVATRPGSWYQDWTTRCLGIRREDAGRYLAKLLPILAQQGVLARRDSADGRSVYGLMPGSIQLRALDETEVNSAALACDTCSWQQTVPPERVDDWDGGPCAAYRCTGHLRRAAAKDAEVDTSAGRDYTRDYYRRLYREAGVFTVITAEHTGMLTREQREQVEREFKQPTTVTAPNVLSCTPTLELGIDIGELSAVILASLPRGPANYVQRVGRAGREDGNALLVALVDRDPRSLYYLTAPDQMIAGRVVPPGAYLSAVEILRRQYFAFLVDRVSRGEIDSLEPMPGRAGHLFGETGWLQALVTLTHARGAVLAADFLALFQAEDGTSLLSDAALAELREFAVAGMAVAVAAAERHYDRQLEDLRRRLDAIDAALGELKLADTDDEQRRESRQLRAERRAVADYRSWLLSAPAQNMLVEFGLLPNYTLVDAAVTLEATLTRTEESEDAEGRIQRSYSSSVVSYQRSARLALTELAPGNQFYVNTYRHSIKGLDIGHTDKPSWRWWRTCPGCGYVRTDNAEADTSPCPRCTRPMADRDTLHRVLVPSTVHAWDRREDAHISDDDENREHRTYATCTAVDIAPGDIQQAWRHTSARFAFGVDVARNARVRTLNLGPAREARADRELAGEQVAVPGFVTCTTCGGVATGGRGTETPEHAPTGSTRIPDHHRPWCARRRSSTAEDHVELVTAYELTTDAVRILLPMATTAVPERLASFAAALHLGIAARYGGSPDHLDTASATMPDPDTGARRRFLVLYDTQPGGTGYLDRLRDPAEFREILALARTHILACPCVGEHLAACHRCLLGHVRHDADYPRVTRIRALELLDSLLGEDGTDGWTVRPIGQTAEIGLQSQVESELEARFHNALLAWAQDPANGATVQAGPKIKGHSSLDLRVPGPDGVRHWQVVLQHTIEGSRADVMFHRLDADGDIAVFLDGFRWHAAAGRTNRIAVDAAKRDRIRARGRIVIQLTWDDVDAWLTGAQRPDLWPPYDGNARHKARKNYQGTLRRDPSELDRTVWANPVQLLLELLADTDAHTWAQRAKGALMGLTSGARPVARADSEGLGAILHAAMSGRTAASVARGTITVVRADDATGLPVVLAIRASAHSVRWLALAMLDDRDTTIEADTDAHRRRWASWLYWGNIVQFLDPREGDEGFQLALSALGDFQPNDLLASGGTSRSRVLARIPADPETGELVESPVDAAILDTGRPPSEGIDVAASEPAATLDAGWQEVAELMDSQEPGLRSLVQRLREAGTQAPEVGYELGEAGWIAELGWPDRRVGVVLAPRDGALSDLDAADRDEAFAADGWTVHPARLWSADELIAHIGGEQERDDGEVGA